MSVAAFAKGTSAWFSSVLRRLDVRPSRTMQVKVLNALEDNYMYLLVDSASKEAAVVDPVEPAKVIEAAKEIGARLTTVLTTHHHWDHAGGNNRLLELAPELRVFGGDDRVPRITNHVADNQEIRVGELTVRCMLTPCHTSGHVCYFVPAAAGQPPAVFTGDTMFIAGCGKFFEGTADQMYRALVERLAKLPDDTRVFCGHEYTVTNLLFAATVEPDNKAVADKLAWARDCRSRKEPTVPSTIAEERSFNPFVRCNEPSVHKHAHLDDPVSTMAFLRKEKDHFRPPTA